MRRSIGIIFKGNGGYDDDRTFGKPPVQIGISRLAISKCEPPPIIVDHDGDMIGIVEGGGAAFERRIIEVPFRLSPYVHSAKPGCPRSH